ncbi:MAG: hypothetical protein QNK11_10125 [Legionella sp.]|nr:hypothetical protein [Legionella sp.]
MFYIVQVTSEHTKKFDEVVQKKDRWYVEDAHSGYIYGGEEFVTYYNDLPSDQKFQIYERHDEASATACSDDDKQKKSYLPGYYITLPDGTFSRNNGENSADNILENGIIERGKKLVSAAENNKEVSKSDLIDWVLDSKAYVGNINVYPMSSPKDSIEYLDLLKQLDEIAKQEKRGPAVKKSLEDILVCIKEPEYNALIIHRNTILKSTIQFIKGEITQEAYQTKINDSRLGTEGKLPYKKLGMLLMALAVAVAACCFVPGLVPVASAGGVLLVGTGLGLIGLGLFRGECAARGEWTGVRKPLQELAETPPEAFNL